ncbi:hypothetical protein D3C72_2412560 [compost metagenome]
MYPIQCLVNAEDGFLDRDGRVFRKFHFQLKNHYQQPGNHGYQTHGDEQQQLQQAAPRVHDFRHRPIALRCEAVRGEQLNPEPMYSMSGRL